MKCEESIPLLSEFRDGALGNIEQVQVRTHLSKCPPCTEIFSELETIVLTAQALREDQKMDFPDENLIWQRMRLTNQTIH
jgi:predicted anti-sigma-YlaC factor YlaD